MTVRRQDDIVDHVWRTIGGKGSIMKTYDTITVSIGRNLPHGGPGFEKLGDVAWSDFRERTIDLVGDYGRIVFSGTGTGIDPRTGATEESFTLVATLTTNITGLYHDLATLAHAYGQDSIALTTGKVSFPGTEA